jgi:uncharacterized protein (DUF58 family)
MAETAVTFRRRAEQLVAHLPPLLVEAEHVAAIVAQGVHGRRRVGPGETFWQFRRYERGDAATMIDWRASAKSMRLFVRENEWEAAESVWLWSDSSASMDFHSRLSDTTKLDRARLLLMALAVLLVRGDENIALLGVDKRPRTGSAALTRFATRLMRNPEKEPPSLPLPEILPKHAQLVLIGDFLEPVEKLDAMIKHFAGLGVTGHLVQVLDPAEETLPYAGRVLFDGMEREGSMLASRAEALRSDYVTRLQAHREELLRLTRSVRWSFTTHHTDSQPQAAVLPLYINLAGQVT